MNVLLDTNVLVSAAISPKGPPADIIKAWREGRFSWVTSLDLLDELRRVLARHRIRRYLTWSTQEVREFLDLAAHAATVVDPSRKIDIIAEDPDDNRILEAAVEAQADYIVSGDSHLRTLDEFEGIRIVSPVRFLALLGEVET